MARYGVRIAINYYNGARLLLNTPFQSIIIILHLLSIRLTKHPSIYGIDFAYLLQLSDCFPRQHIFNSVIGPELPLTVFCSKVYGDNRMVTGVWWYVYDLTKNLVTKWHSPSVPAALHPDVAHMEDRRGHGAHIWYQRINPEKQILHDKQ